MTTNLLEPAPVSSSQLTYNAASKLFSAFASDTNGFGRVWNDSCDEGLTVVSSKTGKRVVFVVEDVAHDDEGDLTYWSLRSLDGAYAMVVFNT